MSYTEELRNLRVCPDCNYIHKQEKELGEECGIDGCESYVILHDGHLEWINPNWG